jgi:hypothetical protein
VAGKSADLVVMIVAHLPYSTFFTRPGKEEHPPLGVIAQELTSTSLSTTQEM